MAARDNYSVGRVYTIAKDELKKNHLQKKQLNDSILVILDVIFVLTYSLCMKQV